MEQSSQQQPSANQQPTAPSTTELVGGDQSTNSTFATQPVASNPRPPLPTSSKKKRAKPSTPTTSSWVWDHFTKLPQVENRYPEAACNYCKKSFFCHSKIHGTSSLGQHLQSCPKYTYAVASDPNQTVLSFGSGKKDLTAASHRFNLEACRKALAKFVVLDEQPVKIVEGEGFKLLLTQLQPQFSLPSRFTLARDCYQLYLDEKNRLKSFFRSNCNRVALTTDCWTSVQNLNYLALTAHFIDNEWNYQKRIISFSVIPNHKGETIGLHIEQVLREWGLCNVSTITVDNASSNDVAVGYLKNRLMCFNGLVLNGDFFHMRCCAHILNLVVGDGLKEVHPSIANIRAAVKYVRSSPSRFAKFKECAEFSRIPCKKLVCLDVPTRWNSTYMMLKAAEKFQPAFEKLAFQDSSFFDSFGTTAAPPSTDDWENTRAFTKFLKVFYDATMVFSSSTSVSIHAAFHQLATILDQIRESSMNLNTVLANMGFFMKEKYDKYWGDILKMNQLLFIGVILDPRFKLNYVQWTFNDWYGEDSPVSIRLGSTVRQKVSRLYSWYAAMHEQQTTAVQSSQATTQGSSNQNSIPSTDAHVKRTQAYRNHLKERNAIDQKNELERYLAEKVLDVDNFDILLWWKQNSSRFPILSNMARDVLATPVSTVASESAFSTGGRVLDQFRSSLKPEMAEALICVQSWLRSSLNQIKDLDLIEDLEVSENVFADIGVASTAGGAIESSTAGGVGQSSHPLH